MRDASAPKVCHWTLHLCKKRRYQVDISVVVNQHRLVPRCN